MQPCPQSRENRAAVIRQFLFLRKIYFAERFFSRLRNPPRNPSYIYSYIGTGRTACFALCGRLNHGTPEHTFAPKRTDRRRGRASGTRQAGMERSSEFSSFAEDPQASQKPHYARPPCLAPRGYPPLVGDNFSNTVAIPFL